MQSPTIGEIHAEDYREGQEIALNCWGGTVVSLRRRSK